MHDKILNYRAALGATSLSLLLAAAVTGCASNAAQMADGSQAASTVQSAQDKPGTTVRPAEYVSERLLPLEGGRNFRDMGGYPAANGKHVRWGVLFRSGTMTNLTDKDYAYLSKRGIRVVCDFRAPDERENEPTRWRATPAAQYVTWDYEMDASAIAELFRAGTPTAQQVRARMIDLYGELAYEFAPRYREMFDHLVSGDVPLAFNCSAGKDRAGIAAALVLTALGVPRESVVADYALSEKLVDYEKEMGSIPQAEGTKRRRTSYEFIRKLSPEVRAPLMRSDPAYITAAFEQIERDYGSVEAFLDKELGVSADDLRVMRQRLLY